MNILMTGADGYIGSHLKPFLESNGHTISTYDDDIADFEITEDVDMVVHLAALTGVRQSINFPREYWIVNVEGFRKVVDECVAKEIKLMYASSSNAKEWWTNPYAITKKTMEEIAKPFEFLGFRPHTVYPGRRDMLYAQLKKNPNKIKYINSKHYRDFTHIEDFCTAFLTLLDNYDIIKHHVIDIGTGHSESVLNFADSMGWNGEVRTTPTPMERTHTEADIKVLKFFNWKPKHSII